MVMDNFNPDVHMAYLKEMQREAEQRRLAKIAQGGQKRALPFARAASIVNTRLNAWQAQRIARREAKAWALAQQIVAENPHLALRDTAC